LCEWMDLNQLSLLNNGFYRPLRIAVFVCTHIFY